MQVCNLPRSIILIRYTRNLLRVYLQCDRNSIVLNCIINLVILYIKDTIVLVNADVYSIYNNGRISRYTGQGQLHTCNYVAMLYVIVA